MDLNKMNIKKIRELIAFTVLLVVALWKFDVVIHVIKELWGIVFPFWKSRIGKTGRWKVCKTGQSAAYHYISA